MAVDEVDETVLIMLDEQFGSSVICIKISGTAVFQWIIEDWQRCVKARGVVKVITIHREEQNNVYSTFTGIIVRMRHSEKFITFGALF